MNGVTHDCSKARNIMRVIFLITIALLTSGCCDLYQPDQPSYPGKTQSWKQTGGTAFAGRFVLKQGESTDNGKVGVKVIEVKRPECSGLFAESPEPYVILRFYKPANQQVLCETTRRIGGTDLVPECGASIGVTAVHIDAINAQEGWVSFDLSNRNL